MFQALLINYYSQLNNQQSSNCHSCRTMIFVAAVTAVLQGHLLVTYLCYKYKLIPMSEGLVLWLNVNTRPEVPWEDLLYSELSPVTALLTTASVCQGPGTAGSWYFGTAAQPTSSERPELSLPQYCDGHHELEAGLPGLHHSGRLRSHHPHRHL